MNGHLRWHDVDVTFTDHTAERARDKSPPGS